MKEGTAMNSLKRSWVLLVCALVACLAMGCSGEVDEGEPLGDVQQALSCPQPTGQGGDFEGAPGAYITAWMPGPLPHQMSITSKTVVGGVSTTDVLDFGVGNGNFTGPGFQSVNGSRITTAITRAVNDGGCLPNENTNMCLAFNGANAIYMDQWYSALLVNGIGLQQSYPNGLTGFRGMGIKDPQKLRVYRDNGALVAYNTWTATGPELTDCEN